MWFQGASTAASNRLWLLPNRQGSIIAVTNATTTVAIDTYADAGEAGVVDLTGDDRA